MTTDGVIFYEMPYRHIFNSNGHMCVCVGGGGLVHLALKLFCQGTNVLAETGKWVSLAAMIKDFQLRKMPPHASSLIY